MRTRSRSPPRLMRGFMRIVTSLNPTGGRLSAGAGEAVHVPTQCLLPCMTAPSLCLPAIVQPLRSASQCFLMREHLLSVSAAQQLDVAEGVDAGVEQGADNGRGLVLDDDRRAGD